MGNVISSANITYDKLYRQSHANIFNLINTRSNVPDPADNVGNRKFVYVREPKKLGRGFNGFPVIIIPSFSISQNNITADTSKANIIYDIDIRVWTQDKASDEEGNPDGASQLDKISENIIKTINANRLTLINYGMSHFELTGSDFDYDEVEGKSLYIREFNIVFSGFRKVIV